MRRVYALVPQLARRDSVPPRDGTSRSVLDSLGYKARGSEPGKHTIDAYAMKGSSLHQAGSAAPGGRCSRLQRLHHGFIPQALTCGVHVRGRANTASILRTGNRPRDRS